MKALQLEEQGKFPVISECRNPVAKKGHVVVQVKAAAMNHRDIWIMKGKYAGLKFPIIPGSDGAGVIIKTGNEVPGEMLGKEVIINPSMQWGEDDRFQGKDFKILGLPDNGTFAEEVPVPVEYIYEKPAHLTFEQAAALPLAGITAYRALFTRAECTSADKVLITGIGGGVALTALVFAAAAGCEVWVTSGNNKKIRDAVSLGAKGGANYKSDSWVENLKKEAGSFDVIIDGAGGEGFADLVNLCSPGARIAIYGGTRGNYSNVSPQRIFWKQISILGSTMGTPTDFHNMLRFVNEHRIVPVVDEVFPFGEAKAAFEKMNEGRQFGKIVLKID